MENKLVLGLTVLGSVLILVRVVIFVISKKSSKKVEAE